MVDTKRYGRPAAERHDLEGFSTLLAIGRYRDESDVVVDAEE